MFCEATGRPTSDIFWTKVPADVSSKVKHNGATWIFTKISVADSGTYSCLADNKVEDPKRGHEMKVIVNGRYIFIKLPYICETIRTDGKFDSFSQFH